MLSSSIKTNLSWTFLGPTRRHTVTLVHNSLTGNRTVTVNGNELYESGWQYSLTGTLLFTLDGAAVEIHVRTPSETEGLVAKASGALLFSLSVNAKEVPPTTTSPSSPSSSSSSSSSRRDPPTPTAAAPESSTWVVALPSGLHQVEFLWSRLDVLVDGVRVDTEADFAEGDGAAGTADGTVHRFLLPVAPPRSATLTAVPATAADRRAGSLAMKTTLHVDGIGVVQQSELLGRDGGR
jgi:hypothetical protein